MQFVHFYLFINHQQIEIVYRLMHRKLTKTHLQEAKIAASLEVLREMPKQPTVVPLGRSILWGNAMKQVGGTL